MGREIPAKFRRLASSKMSTQSWRIHASTTPRMRDFAARCASWLL
jgi:hypothetical protein